MIKSLSPEEEKQAGEFLKTMETAYRDMGPAGNFGLVMAVLPLKRRWESGERSKKIFKEIMELA
jgi:hypothetical protein